MRTAPRHRRHFLKGILKLPIAVAVSCVGLRFRPAFAADGGDDILDAHQAATLRQFCYRLFPYPEVGDEPYRLAVSAMSALAGEDEAVHALLVGGVASLDKRQEADWLELDEARQVAAMRALEQGDFFRWVYRISVNRIFTHASVWEHIGYEGSSLEFGGYLHNGFDDIDWL